MFISLTDILDDLFDKHHGGGGVNKKLDAIEKDVLASLEDIAAIAQDVKAIMAFVGISGPPGTVTDAQIAETLAKLQAAQALVVKFNP